MQVRLFNLFMAALLVAGVVGCQGEITQEDLELWSNSPAGWDKIQEVIEDKEVPIDTKIRAIDLLIQKGTTSKVKDILYQSKYRQELAEGLKKVLTDRFNKTKGDEQVLTKEGILMILRYFKPEQRDQMQKMVAAWAFEGLKVTDTTEKIKTQIERRMKLSQVPDLGMHGVDGAGILLSHGFGVNQMYQFIRGLKKPEYNKIALDGFKRLHKIPNIEISPSHLQMISELKTLDAVIYLIDIYSMDDQNTAVREDALGLAIDMFEKEEIQAKKASLVPVLKKLLAERHPENRRLAAHYILKFGGVNELKTVLAGLKDDGMISDEYMDSQPFMRDFCRDVILTLPKAKVIPTLVNEAKNSENRVVRALALVCLKMTADPAHLQLFKLGSSIPTDIDDILGGKLTLGRLAENAYSAVDRIQKMQQDVAAKQMDPKDFELKKKLYLDELEVSDKFLDEIVGIKFEAFKKKGAYGSE